MTTAVSEYLDYYLREDVSARSAVLLTGPWGAGKTHFVKAYFASRDAKARAEDPLRNRSHLYVSLYGVRRLEEINEQFFTQLHPVVGSGAVKLLGTVLSRAVNVAAGSEALKSDDAAVIRALSLRKLSGLILVFDDLERVSMPIDEVLGFINGFVEHESMKVILVANEKEIKSKRYTRIKEKLVGRTLKISSDPNVVLDEYVEGIRNEIAKAAVVRHRTSILATFEASGTRNYRSLFAALGDFERLVDVLDERLGTSDEATRRIVLFLVAAGCELRSGSLNANELAEVPSASFGFLISHASGSKVSEKTAQLKSVADRYPEVNWSDLILPIKLMSRLIESGELDVTEANELLSQHPIVAGAKAVPSWRQIWRWFELNALEYSAAKNALLKDLEVMSIVHPAEILHVTGILLRLRFYDERVLGRAKVERFMCDYIDQVDGTNVLLPEASAISDIDKSGWGGLGYQDADSEGFAKVRQHLLKAVLKAEERDLKGRAPRVLEDLTSNSDSYDLLIDFGRDGLGSLPILAFIDLDEFADLLVGDGAWNDRLFNIMLHRYERDRFSAGLVDEHPWVAKLQDRLATRVHKLTPPHRKRAEQNLRNWWERVTPHLAEAEKRKTSAHTR